MDKYYHEKEVSIPLYSGKAIIIFTNDGEKLKKYPHLFYEDDFYAYSYFDVEHSDDFYIVLNFNHPYKKITHGVVSHESLHLTDFILNDRGVVADFENDEPITYLLNWVVDEVYKFARDTKMNIEYAD